ncbi:MAG TPA: type II toxin-antitoxin system VapC family toxin [Gemmataceae bacterium]|nr:type II toxin-antitoxin system VapC family toxin [Gemmataceae bacterium]
MTAFDSDILTLIWEGVDPYASWAALIPSPDRGIPIVVAEEVLRGRLDQIRKASAGKVKVSLPGAYDLLQFSLTALRGGVYLPFTDRAEQLIASWRAARFRVKVMDMRIAATAMASGATLVTRNAGDFTLIPGLSLDVWT